MKLDLHTFSPHHCTHLVSLSSRWFIHVGFLDEGQFVPSLGWLMVPGLTSRHDMKHGWVISHGAAWHGWAFLWWFLWIETEKFCAELCTGSRTQLKSRIYLFSFSVDLSHWPLAWWHPWVLDGDTYNFTSWSTVLFKLLILEEGWKSLFSFLTFWKLKSKKFLSWFKKRTLKTQSLITNFIKYNEVPLTRPLAAPYVGKTVYILLIDNQRV